MYGVVPFLLFQNKYIPSGFALVNRTQGTNPYTIEPHGITTTCVFFLLILSFRN